MTKRNSSITFRVSDHEKKRINGKAQSAQFTTSDFCRHAALGKEVQHIEGLNECNYELNKIGNNINQLTVLCHQRRIENPDLRSIHGKLCAVLDSIVDRLGGGGEDGDSQTD
ncbi:MAG: plasmid mobilization relaxosome protein MobC [Clostridia bacterium]